MIRKVFYKFIAKRYTKKGNALIKIKVVNEKNREVIVSGDSNYIMGSVGYILHRISVVEGVPYEKLIFDLVEAHKNVEESGVVN